MSTTQILALLLALSVALNIAVSTGLLVHHTGAGTAQAILSGAAAAAAALGIYLAAVAAYS
ncbi:hypothetical protein ACFCZQ_29410 [Streptomyces virginiae]|uniref:hypothetical protein n=1 Tax=Streptomyces virginiae TaxID=1961 RepID=UPI0035DAFA9E